MTTIESRQPVLPELGLPRLGGRIGPSPEDFQVEELPAYEPSGSGEHWYVKLRKRERTTRDAVLALARAAGISDRDIGYAGMKDRHGVTTQWFSLPGKAPPPERYELGPELGVVSVSRHSNKLRTGHLRGNRFLIGVVDAEPGGAERATALFEVLSQSGLLNTFGAQRFGRDGKNLAEAIGFVRGERRLPRDRARFLSKLYASVVQAEVFNRYAVARAALGFDRLVHGEVVRLAGAGASFVVEDVERELVRYLARDLCLTGPLPGPKQRPAAREAARELELAVESELGLDERARDELGRHAPGARRDLIVHPEAPSAETVADRVVLRFELPSGSYATEVLRQLGTGPHDPAASGEVESPP